MTPESNLGTDSPAAPATANDAFSSVGSNLPDTWEAKPTEPVPVQTETAPVADAPVVPAADAAVPDAAPADEFLAAAEAPTPEIYGKLLGVRTELTSQLEAVKGRAALLSPILDQTFEADDDPKLIEAGAQLFDQLKDTDPRLTTAVLNGAIERYPGFLLDWAMESLGVTKEDYAALQTFKESGSWPGGAPVVGAQLFVPDAEGYAKLPDGSDIFVGEGAPDANKTLLALAKKDYERGQSDATAAKTQQEQAQQRIQAEAQQRASTWGESRGQIFDQAISKLNLNFGEEFKEYAGDVQALAFAYARTDDKILGLISDGSRLAGENASKGALEKAAEVDRLTNEHVAKAATRISRLINEVITLRQKVGSGEPIVPGEARPTPIGEAAAASATRQPTRRQDPYESIWGNVGSNLSDSPRN